MNRHEQLHARAIGLSNRGLHGAAIGMYRLVDRENSFDDLEPLWVTRYTRDYARSAWQHQIASRGYIADPTGARRLLEDSLGFAARASGDEATFNDINDEIAATIMFQGRLAAAEARDRIGGGFNASSLERAISLFRKASLFLGDESNQWYRYGANVRGQLVSMLARDEGAAEVFSDEADNAINVEPGVMNINPDLTKLRKLGVPALKFAYPLSKNAVAKRVLL